MKYEKKQRRYLKSLKEKFEEFKGVCSGCNRIVQNAEGSHRIPRSLCIGTLEPLYWEKENIDLFCRACHNKMNSPDMVQLKNFQEILDYYKKAAWFQGEAGRMYIKPLYEKTKLYETM